MLDEPGPRRQPSGCFLAFAVGLREDRERDVGLVCGHNPHSRLPQGLDGMLAGAVMSLQAVKAVERVADELMRPTAASLRPTLTAAWGLATRGC